MRIQNTKFAVLKSKYRNPKSQLKTNEKKHCPNTSLSSTVTPSSLDRWREWRQNRYGCRTRSVSSRQRFPRPGSRPLPGVPPVGSYTGPAAGPGPGKVQVSCVYITIYYLILSYIILYYIILYYIILYDLILSYIILYYPRLSLYYLIL